MLVALVTACASSNDSVTRLADLDRLEADNREVHAFNKMLDKTLLRPGGNAYSQAVPEELHQGLMNFVDNLAQPGEIVNGVLQGDFEGVVKNSFRFLINSTVGLFGVLDPASKMEMYADHTDFGETLHVWGVGEGDYVELPVFGPSTSRDAVGTLVDFFTNPLTAAMPSPEKHIGTVGKLMSKVGQRGRYSETIDSVLYESADSYAQAKLFYLQNRRHELGDINQDVYVDIYEDPYDE